MQIKKSVYGRVGVVMATVTVLMVQMNNAVSSVVDWVTSTPVQSCTFVAS